MFNLFDIFPYLESNRLILKKLEANDAAALLRMSQNKAVYRYLPTFLIEQQCADMLEIINRSNTEGFDSKKYILLGIYLKTEHNRFCGLAEIYHYDEISHKVTIGYRLDEEFWGKGIATEIVEMITRYLFSETDVEIIGASHFSENPASGNVLKKNGFQKYAASIEENWGYKQKILVDKWYLKNTVKPETLDFLFSVYFGITPKDLRKGAVNKKQIALNCADRAYRDFNRTLRFKSENEKEQKNFRNDICELIISMIQDQMLCDGSDFDTAHREICKEIINKANEYKNILIESVGGTPSFTYGHAQKWLNMTIKYIWLLGLWNEEFQKIKDKLHIPVDRYVLKAASAGAYSARSKKKNANPYGLCFRKIPVKHKYGEKASYYTEFLEEKTVDDKKSQPWSQWDENDYINFVRDLRSQFNAEMENRKEIGKTLIEWENKAWIEQAKLEK